MIDYEKLKIASNLAEKYHKQTNIPICIEYNVVFGGGRNIINCYINYLQICFDHIDGCISHFQKLTKPAPKYKVGDILYMATEYIVKREMLPFQHIESFEVSSVEIIDDVIVYSGEGQEAIESICYKSKSELINAQISHWTSLRDESVTEKSCDNINIPFPTCCTKCNEPYSCCDCQDDVGIAKDKQLSVICCDMEWFIMPGELFRAICGRCGKLLQDKSINLDISELELGTR